MKLYEKKKRRTKTKNARKVEKLMIMMTTNQDV